MNFKMDVYFHYHSYVFLIIYHLYIYQVEFNIIKLYECLRKVIRNELTH